MAEKVFENWQAVLKAPRPRFSEGATSDVRVDINRRVDVLFPCDEPLFTQSNARVLAAQSAAGSLRLAALPTQLYPAPVGESEYGLGPGMYHKFDVAMYLGDLTYLVQWEGDDKPTDLCGLSHENTTFYASYFLPLTQADRPGLQAAVFSLAPLAPDADKAALAPAPLPGPAGIIYGLYLRNTGDQVKRGKVLLQASDLLIGHYEDANPAYQTLKKPTLDIRQGTLILSRPEGSVGIHLHGGTWAQMAAPFTAEMSITLQPGEERLVEAHLALGASFAEVMPVIYALHLRPALDWLNLTAAYWHARLGVLQVGDPKDDHNNEPAAREIYIRALFDNFNCLQTDAQGNLLAHWQGAPSHGYGIVWGIDVEPTAVSIAHLCPELARQVLLFFITRSQAPRGKPEHSIPIRVAPLVIARQWLQASGDTDYLERHPEILKTLRGIMDDVLALKHPDEMLFPSCYSSDGPVGRRYDYGTNVKVWYAFEALAYLLRAAGHRSRAERYTEVSSELKAAVYRHMLVKGPFGEQISGGANLGEDPGSFYLPEGQPYYDGEDTTSMLAPIYGFCDFDDAAWVNYHRFARSAWCANFDPEFEALRWSPGEFGSSSLDGTSYFSRLGGSLAPAEMREGLDHLVNEGMDDVTGSVFWWPHGLVFKRSLTRCSQGQGAWAWQYFQQWLGLEVDAPARTLTLAPRGLHTRFEWQGLHAGDGSFDVRWEEKDGGAKAVVRNHCPRVWKVTVGFRRSGAGAAGPLEYQSLSVKPGEKAVFTCKTPAAKRAPLMDRKAIFKIEAAALAAEDGVVFKRYGPAQLWGPWQYKDLWNSSVMPYCLRFKLVNATGQDWEDVSVELTLPEGWKGQARQPQHWEPPLKMAPGALTLNLGRLRSLDGTAAPFWLTAPEKWAPAYLEQSFHTISQPGDDILLIAAPDVPPSVHTFSARLTARKPDGSAVVKDVTVQFKVEPHRS